MTLEQRESPQPVDPEVFLDPEGKIDLVALHLREAGRVPLLTAEQEVRLANQLRQGRSAREQLKSPELAGDKALLAQVARGESARRHMIEANQRLVISIAKRYQGRGLPLLDLIQEGNIGLMRSVEKFDPDKGFKFSTYATWWINQSVGRGNDNKGKMIRIPTHMLTHVRLAGRLEEAHVIEKGVPPTEDEFINLLTSTGLSEDEALLTIETYRAPIHHVGSLNRNVDFENDFEVGELVPGPDDTEEEASVELDRVDLQKTLSKLPPRQQEVLKMRFGFIDGRPLTLEEAGARLGVTRERARQLEGKALRTLRHVMKRGKVIQQWVDHIPAPVVSNPPAASEIEEAPEVEEIAPEPEFIEVSNPSNTPNSSPVAVVNEQLAELVTKKIKLEEASRKLHQFSEALRRESIDDRQAHIIERINGPTRAGRMLILERLNRGIEALRNYQEKEAAGKLDQAELDYAYVAAQRIVSQSLR